KGTYGRIVPRSGLAKNKFIGIGAGVIDPDYTGPVGIVVFNHGQEPFEIKIGDRIAQLILEQYKDPQPIEVEQLEDTPRADKGFGHSGINNTIDINIIDPDDFEQSTQDTIIKFNDIDTVLQVLEKEILESNSPPLEFEVNEITLKEEELNIPDEYKEYEQLFKDKEIGTLPPHRTYDHAIPLEPGKTAPFGRIYNLSQTELKELYNYIQENLEKGFIRRSESPA